MGWGGRGRDDGGGDRSFAFGAVVDGVVKRDQGLGQGCGAVNRARNDFDFVEDNAVERDPGREIRAVEGTVDGDASEKALGLADVDHAPVVPEQEHAWAQDHRYVEKTFHNRNLLRFSPTTMWPDSRKVKELVAWI